MTSQLVAEGKENKMKHVVETEVVIIIQADQPTDDDANSTTPSLFCRSRNWWE
jgi:hypothetical protein